MTQPHAQDVSNATSTQPDIGYYPDLENYGKRTSRRLKEERLIMELPRNFPGRLDSVAAWDSSISNQQDKWLFWFAQDEITELKQAIRHFKSR